MFCLKVKKVVRHCKSIATLVFNKEIRSLPGQFVMLNVFDYEEIPLSLSSPNSVTVKVVGETTRALVNFKGGETVGVRGPFGRPFSFSKKALIVAGGIGIAPLRYLYHRLKDKGSRVRVLYGARSKEELVFLEEFEDVVVSTDDGSYGFKGNVVELVKSVGIEGYERIYCCGPPVMLKKLYDLFKKMGILSRVEFSIERYMRCGIGVCGSCVIEGGLRVCKEGPVFRGDEILMV